MPDKTDPICRQAMRRHTADSDALAAAVAPFTLDRTVELTDADPVGLAKLLAAVRHTGRIAVETGTGVTMSATANITARTHIHAAFRMRASNSKRYAAETLAARMSREALPTKVSRKRRSSSEKASSSSLSMSRTPITSPSAMMGTTISDFTLGLHER